MRGRALPRDLLLRGGRLVDPASGLDAVGDLLVRDGAVAALGDAGAPAGSVLEVDVRGALVTPAFLDLHVHLREPGGEEAETVASGTEAALAGGFALVCAMPNTSPVADEPSVLRRVLEAATAAGPCEVAPVSSITKGLLGRELVDFAAQSRAGAVGFSDDGVWVADRAVAAQAFAEAARGGWLLLQHCEDPALSRGGCVHGAPGAPPGPWPTLPREAEDVAADRDVDLARLHGTRLHLCHVSTAGSLATLRAAKAEGLAVSGEATPHHLTLTVEDARRGGPDFKMKPPLRERADVDALVEGLADGTIDAVATDHAPHPEARKAAGMGAAPFGVIGLETAFPVAYTRLVEERGVPLLRLVAALTTGPARVLRRPTPSLAPGAPARVAVIDVSEPRVVDRGRLRSKSRNCPFHGLSLRGWPTAVVLGRTFVDLGPPG
jgi:dihydroorotase